MPLSGDFLSGIAAVVRVRELELASARHAESGQRVLVYRDLPTFFTRGRKRKEMEAIGFQFSILHMQHLNAAGGGFGQMAHEMRPISLLLPLSQARSICMNMHKTAGMQCKHAEAGSEAASYWIMDIRAS